MFNRNSCVSQNFLFLFLFLSLFSCFVKKGISGSDFISLHSREFDLNNLNWLWNFDYSKKNFDEHFNIDSSSYVYVAYLFKKIGFEEKFVEYMKKAIASGDSISSQFAGIKLIEYFNSIKEYSASELIGERLYKKYENNKFIMLGYFKSLYWQKKNDKALSLLNKLDKMKFSDYQENENILLKAALYLNLSNIGESKIYFNELFENLHANNLHVRAYDYFIIENKSKHFGANFLNLVKFKYEVANGNFNSAINILNKNGLSDYYDNNIILSDIYKAYIGSGKISNALTFFSKIKSKYKNYYLGILNLRKKNNSGFILLKEYLEGLNLNNEINRLALLNTAFSNLIYTKNTRDYFAESVAKFYTESDKKNSTFIKILEEYILESIQLEDYDNLYKLYYNAKKVISDPILSKLAFINARLIYHKLIKPNVSGEYNSLLHAAVNYDKWSYSSFMSRYLLDQNIDEFFANKFDAKYEQSDYEIFLEGFLKFNLCRYVREFISEDFRNGYRFSLDFYRRVYDELLKSENYYDATLVINYLVSQDESSLMENDYKRLYPYLYGSLVEYWAKRRGIETSIVFSLIKAESSFEKNAVSKPGAVGLMQVMPATANDISKELKYFDYDLKIPRDNIIIGTYYLKKRISTTGSLYKALASYNGGIGNVRKWEKSYGHLSKELFIEAIPFNQTRNYIKKILVYSVFYDALYEKKGMDSVIVKIMGEFPKN
ncbi:flagellar assembly lytic transglycosylase [Borreliella sinica]|uniref:flagellar assembly lytic transglycosylase n=1 Tax=Borreliella sinica TaxID=87162 RepID=UPI002A23EE28|nr:lytic transglycosylase domain-containing protein [Borreliella sinica]WPM06305.1 lytic transglycosylase domain-containing protein [Borreliella sinica]